MLSKTEAPAPAPFAKPHSENPVTCAPWAKAPRKKRYFGLRSLRGRVWRRAGIAIKAHIYPYNSGMLAGEALVSPFFGNAQVAHAKYPVSVDTVFPRTG
ncbi:hypothetical protein H632_c5515p0 [Helicosporidium sp. ATCC 50920]|nr:hypothetical protein H632_c5515p0 [Helicosporidium sp. ATCC 50920]|eukprot:KDD71227.1 hypothetical protein H632_c5515p0 [Helicosporidium sp. ATCC 50920]